MPAARRRRLAVARGALPTSLARARTVDVARTSSAAHANTGAQVLAVVSSVAIRTGAHRPINVDGAHPDTTTLLIALVLASRARKTTVADTGSGRAHAVATAVPRSGFRTLHAAGGAGETLAAHARAVGVASAVPIAVRARPTVVYGIRAPRTVTKRKKFGRLR